MNADIAQLALLRYLHHMGCVHYVTAAVTKSELRIVPDFCAGCDLVQRVSQLQGGEPCAFCTTICTTTM